MKIWMLFVLLSLPLSLKAAPVTYRFSGHINYLHDSYADGYGLDPGFYDWWPKLGDSYHGTLTFDADQLIYDYQGLTCFMPGVCGGLVDFEMQLGSKKAVFNGASIAVMGSSGEGFIAWSQSIGQFDSFNFSSGSFIGVDGGYWDSIGGAADSFVQVPEPPVLALLILSMVGVFYSRAFRSSQLKNRFH